MLEGVNGVTDKPRAAISRRQAGESLLSFQAESRLSLGDVK